MSETRPDQLDPGLSSCLPADQRDAVQARAKACSSCTSFRGIDRLDTRCGAVNGERVSLTLGRCKLRKWPAFAPADELVLPELHSDSPGLMNPIRQMLYSGRWRRIEGQNDPAELVRLRRKTYSPGITLITPTGDRPEAIRLCVRWMQQQRIDGTISVQWIVVDDGHVPVDRACFTGVAGKGWSVDILRREPRDDDPPHTLCLNMCVALPEIKHDKILIIEDDDYYSPKYVATVTGWLDRADLVGETSANLYFLRSRKYQCFQNHQLAGWCKTGFRPAVIPAVWHAAASSNQHALDLRVWKGWRGTKLLVRNDPGQGGFCIGIKGVPGRRGLTWGEGCTAVDDPLLDKLYEWIGPDAGYYRGLLGEGLANSKLPAQQAPPR